MAQRRDFGEADVFVEEKVSRNYNMRYLSPSRGPLQHILEVLSYLQVKVIAE